MSRGRPLGGPESGFPLSRVNSQFKAPGSQPALEPRGTLAIPPKVLTNRDLLVNASRSQVARLCVLLFDRIQLHRIKEEQLLALAGAFALMCDVLKVAPQEAFTAVRNLMVDKEGPDGLVHQFSAMKYHLQTELCA